MRVSWIWTQPTVEHLRFMQRLEDREGSIFAN